MHWASRNHRKPLICLEVLRAQAACRYFELKLVIQMWAAHTKNPEPQTTFVARPLKPFKPTPYTLNFKLSTLDPEPQTQHARPLTLYPLCPKSQTLKPTAQTKGVAVALIDLKLLMRRVDLDEKFE